MQSQLIHFSYAMPLLLTGICGFAGSVIARELLAHCSDLHIIGKEFHKIEPLA